MKDRGEKMKAQKTNVMRLLEQKKIGYVPHEYPHGDAAVDGRTVAAAVIRRGRCDGGVRDVISH